MSGSTPPAALPPAESTLQGLAFESLGDAWQAAGALFSDAEAAVAVSCTQAIVLSIADLANELRASRQRADRAIEQAFGDGNSADLEAELHPNGEGYRSASNS